MIYVCGKSFRGCLSLYGFLDCRPLISCVMNSNRPGANSISRHETAAARQIKNYSARQQNSGTEGEGKEYSGRGWVDRPVDGYAHIYSDGTNVSVLFQSREDFIFGMNLIAVTACQCAVVILTVQVMETHFHLIAKGRSRDCDRFARSIAIKLESYLTKTGRRFAVNGHIRVSNDPIATENELKTKFMYVYRNAISAGYPLAPWKYEWGPGDIYFVDHNSIMMLGRRIGEYPVLTRRAMFHTATRLPEDWRCNDEGMLLPHSYIDWKSVESLFKSPKAFLAFLSQKKDVEAEIDRECSAGVVHRVSETELRREAKAMCAALWGLPTISRASVEQRMAVAQKLWSDRRTYSLSVLSRVAMLDKAVLESVFGK